MPILKFMPRFVGPILSGCKVHTVRCSIRQHRKGEILYMQTGRRYRPVRFLTVPAMRVRDIDLSHNSAVIWSESRDGFVVPNRELFARSDGFSDWNELRSFFAALYGRDGQFEVTGQLIQWAIADWEK